VEKTALWLMGRSLPDCRDAMSSDFLPVPRVRSSAVSDGLNLYYFYLLKKLAKLVQKLI
jgi:hypothetical protein